MIGNTIGEFIDDILLTGGPEKEFLFRNKFYFLETVFNKSTGMFELKIDEYENYKQKNEEYIRTYCFSGNCYAECVADFEKAKLFDGMNIYQAEQEITIIFG